MMLEASRPDIILLHKSDKTAWFIEVSVQNDVNVTVKEKEKLPKYGDSVFNCKMTEILSQAVTIVLVVVGATGLVKTIFE